jgi:hypothetical protein
MTAGAEDVIVAVIAAMLRYFTEGTIIIGRIIFFGGALGSTNLPDAHTARMPLMHSPLCEMVAFILASSVILWTLATAFFLRRMSEEVLDR